MKIRYFHVEESRFKMEKCCTLLVTLLLVLILVSSADVEVILLLRIDFQLILFE